MKRVLGLGLVLSLGLAGCGDDDEERAQVQEPSPGVSTPEAPVVEEGLTASPADEEACAQILIVAHNEAQPRPPDVTRTKDEARARLETIWARIEAGESFEELARAESDGRSTGARGGLAGTYARADWPPIHADILGSLYGLGVNQISRPVDAAYGWVLVRRCAVARIHIRHILIRYAGARNADEETTRTRDEAELLANALRVEAGAEGAEFTDLAREQSEDGSAESGGDLGPLGRGLLVAPVEDAAAALHPGQLSGVVESPFGFHIIQRVE